MSYLLKNKPKKDNRFRNSAIFVLIAILIGVSYFFPGPFQNLFYTIGRPLWSLKSATTGTISPIRDFFASRSALSSRNATLEEEATSLRLKLLSYDSLLAQNEDLKSQLGRRGSTGRIVARVLSKPPASPYDTFLIDMGTDAGLTSGDAVYISDTIAIGTVTSATPHTSLVTLFSSPGEKEAMLERTGATYKLSGNGGANFTIEAPKDADIVWGDIFTYSLIPGAVLGSVYYIDSNSQSSFKTIHIRMPGNVFQTKWVQVEHLP